MNCRICIMGNPGSGKSTLATELGRRLSLPVYHLDRELLHSDFQRHTNEYQEQRHRELIAGEEWIIDGDYRNLTPERFERATLVVFLHLPKLTSLQRVWRRHKSGGIKHAIPDDAKDYQLSLNFIWWTLKISSRQRLQWLRQALQLHPKTKLLVLAKGSQEDWVLQVLSTLEST